METEIADVCSDKCHRGLCDRGSSKIHPLSIRGSVERFDVYFIHSGMWLCIIDGRLLSCLSAPLDPFGRA